MKKLPPPTGFGTFQAEKAPTLGKAEFYWPSPKMDAWFSQMGFYLPWVPFLAQLSFKNNYEMFLTQFRRIVPFFYAVSPSFMY